MNASLATPQTHKEYIYYEARFGGVKDRTSMVRLSRQMYAHVGTIARQEDSDCSTVIRHAVFEYLERQGFKPFQPQ